MKKQNKGITLISLVITIIILLILAGISISALTENRLFEKAKISKEETRGANIQEKVELWKMNQELNDYTNDERNQTLEELLNDLQNQKLITPEEVLTIKQVGKVTIGSRTIIFEETSNDSSQVQVGDLVKFNFDTSDDSEPIEYITKNTGCEEQTFRVGDYSGGWYYLGTENRI